MVEIILCGAIFSFSLLIKKKLVSPVCMFSGIWFFILLVYRVTISQLSPVSDSTHIILLLGISFFALGSVLYEMLAQYRSGGRKTYYKKELAVNGYKDELRYSWILPLCIISTLCLLPDAWDALKSFLSGNTFQMLRAQHSEGSSVITNRIVLVTLNYIVNPFCVLIVPICAIDFIMGQKKKWLLGFTMLITFLQTFITGGRIQLVYIPLHFLIVFFYAKGKIRISRKIRRAIIAGVVMAVFALNFVTTSRGSSWQNQTFGLYVSGGIPLMDHYLSNINGHYSFGAAALSGYLRTAFSLLENIGFGYPAFLTNIQSFMDVEKVVGIGALQMNAFVTCFYYFFLDGGFIGVAVESALYGALAKFCYLKSKQNSQKMLAIYCLILQGIVFSMVRFQFIIISYCLSFILIQFLFVEKKEVTG